MRVECHLKLYFETNACGGAASGFKVKISTPLPPTLAPVDTPEALMEGWGGMNGWEKLLSLTPQLRRLNT